MQTANKPENNINSHEAHPSLGKAPKTSFIVEYNRIGSSMWFNWNPGRRYETRSEANAAAKQAKTRFSNVRIREI